MKTGILRIFILSILLFVYTNAKVLAQNNFASKNVSTSLGKTNQVHNNLHTKGNKSMLSGCNVDTSQNGIYLFRDQSGNAFNLFLCGINDSVSATFANGYPFKDGDGFKIKLIQGSQVTFSVGDDSCSTHPVSLTVCDSLNNPISGAYSPSGCPNFINFNAPYTGQFIIVMNENGICFGSGQLGIGEIFCYKQVGTTLPSCLPFPPNDSICGALPLTIGGAFYHGDNTTASLVDDKDTNVMGCGFGCSTPNNTLWYSYTATATGNISIACYSPATQGLDTWVGVFEAASCTDSLMNGSCYGGPNAIGDTVRIPLSVIAGTTYYFMIDGDNGSIGEFELGLEVVPLYPVNDTICGAADLILNGAFISGNTSDAQGNDPSDVDVANAGYNCGLPNNTEWFKYTPAVSDSFDLVMSANGMGFSSWIGEFRTSTSTVDCHWPLIFEQCLSGTNNSFGDSSMNRIYLSSSYNYFFMIDGFANSNGVFSIGINSVTHVDINEFESNFRSLFVYPNPVSDVLNVNYKLFEKENIQFQLLDLTGRVLIFDAESGIKEGSKIINVKNINNGIYLLRLIGEKGSCTRKVMVQK